MFESVQTRGGVKMKEGWVTMGDRGPRGWNETVGGSQVNSKKKKKGGRKVFRWNRKNRKITGQKTKT